MKRCSRSVTILILLGIVIAASLLIAAPGSAARMAGTPPARTFPATNTPRPTRTPTATPTATATPIPIEGRLCRDCNRLRLRETPGTAGNIVDILSDDVEFYIIGRSDDGRWVHVLLKDGRRGWISALYVRNADRSELDPERLAALEVQGVAVEASPTPTSPFLASVPPWLSGISGHARQIYLRGQSLGNRPNAFSRVGDSITASSHFLYPFGYGPYNLGEYGYLSGVLGFFGESFRRESLAAGGGWSADKLLTPGYAFQSICGSEAPLVCEYKQHQPAVALIMLGTNDSGSGSPDAFADHLRQIVEISIEMGVIPVLSTIPPKNIDENQEQRVNAFNEVIRATARRFDIPLWDYHANMLSAPNRGLSADGLHPSVPPGGAGVLTPEQLQYGYTIRNLNALQVLDALWRTVMY